MLEDRLAALSGGSLEADLSSEFPAEYSELKTNFNSAVAAIRSVVTQIASSGSTIDRSSNEISVAVQDLANRTEKGAVTLQKVSSEVNDLTTSAQSAANAASEVKEITVKAQKDVEANEVLVRDTVRGDAANPEILAQHLQHCRHD